MGIAHAPADYNVGSAPSGLILGTFFILYAFYSKQP